MPRRLQQAAHKRGLRGHQQQHLERWLERRLFTWRSVWIGRRALAKLLGGLDDRNTRKRLKRFEALGLIRMVQGGGRRRGFRKDGRVGVIGLANRYYPGPELVPLPWTDKLIERDNERERQRIEGARPVSKDMLPPSETDTTPAVDAARFRQLATSLEPPRAGP